MSNVIGNGIQTTSYCVSDLLFTHSFMGNKIKLGLFLKIDRKTVAKHVDDTKQLNHMIIRRDGKYIFMSTTRNKAA